MSLHTGQSNEIEFAVTEEMCADYHGNNGVQVMSTPYLIGSLEQAAAEVIQPTLPEGSGSVGTAVTVRHLAATPLGMKIRSRARVTEIDGKRITFQVEAEDEVEIVMSGTHERYIVGSIEKFMARVRGKAAGK